MARTMQSKRKPVFHRETPSTWTSTLQTAPKPDPAAVPSTSTSSGSGLASTTRPPKAKVPREPLPKEAFIRETRSKRALREQNVEEQPPPKQQKQAVKAKAARAPVAAAVKKEEQAQASIRRIGQKFSPGDGQLDYVITAPMPTRDPVTKEFNFADFPRFKPNLSPEEIIRRGSFDGGFFRPVKSKKSGRELHEDWSDFPKEWYEGLSSSMYLTRPEGAEDSVNKWQARMGQPYEAWEANGWIVPEHDARGWYQWYYRFFLGRRCDDDERQVGRWDRVAGEASGRWRRILLQKYRQKGVSFVEPNEEEVSPGIRQTLQHWASLLAFPLTDTVAYDPTTEALNRFREEKGDNVANEDADEE
ncbi:hypothetical protein BMF94_0679 [Rhodotorula taiwanensis]|uniref:Uncharacterized protein n=1 Tax=Rhodotorula taiwanensis TaxID=741276 RepID=A0A2S5BI68_9BASI|nr:hypothetical protein BMF94_0679 [Rhodotorula taiwanensis]